MKHLAHAARRADRDERGVVLIAVLGAILILSILIAALVLASFGETAISRQQASANQALFLAEAGAYRALAELRRRLAVNLAANITVAPPAEVVAACEADQGWRLAAAFAHEGTESDWVEDHGTGQAVLALNAGEPITVLDGGGREVGRFTATIRLRSAGAEGHASTCERGDATTPERYRMFLHYEVQATATTRNARRAVGLSSPPDLPLEVFVERASFSRWALLLLRNSEVWLRDASVIGGPAHTNMRWWISGHPTFFGPISSADPLVRFGNCGSPIELDASVNPVESSACEGDRPRYLGGALVRGVPRLEFPSSPPNLARVALGLEPEGSDPSDDDVRLAAVDQVKSGEEIPAGIYIANSAGDLRHPRTGRPTGIYIRGNVAMLALVVEEGRQVILIQVADATAEQAATLKIILDPDREAMHVGSGEAAGTNRTYRGTFNGVIYIDGTIESFFGTVHRASQLTVVAREDITVTDHVVYMDPPSVGNAEPSPNVLGVYTEDGSVKIDGTGAPVDLYFDGVVLAPNGKFWTDGFDRISDKGTIHVLGGIIEGEFGQFGTTEASDATRRGYQLDLRYDERLLGQVTPPFFPRTDRYAAPRPRLDALYEKPTWREIAIP